MPDRVLTIDAVMMTAYAGATWDWFQTHVDSAAAAAAGFPRPIVDGQMLGAFLAAHAQDGIGPDARVVAMSFRHHGGVFRGDVIRVRGTRGAPDAEARVTVTQTIEVVDGTDDGRVVVTGETTTGPWT